MRSCPQRVWENIVPLAETVHWHSPAYGQVKLGRLEANEIRVLKVKKPACG